MNAAIGNLVWNDVNADGLQDSSEPGIADVAVDLLVDDDVVQSTTTDANGHYAFGVSDTSATYRVQITIPTGYAATAIFTSAADEDSNIDSDGFTEWFTLTNGETNNTRDAGLVSTALGELVGNYVWLDDGDGIQETSESGMSGVTVNLYDVAYSLVATTTSDSNGEYCFSDLPSNTYYQLEFVIPEGYEPTTQHAGAATADSDIDAFGFTDQFWVAPGTTDANLDAGLKAAAAPDEPVILIRNAAGNNVDKLRVARWENAFEKPGASIQVKSNFIDLDPERFHILVFDATKNTNATAQERFTVNVSTTSDTGNDILMTEFGTNSDWFWSDWMLLTSVAKDDEYAARGIGPDANANANTNTPGDPTFFVKLGDTVTATYGTKTATATVPVEKVVKLHINILRKTNGGNPVIDNATVEGYVKSANEIYAAVGIRVDLVGNINVENPPQDVDLTDGLQGFSWDLQGKLIMSPAAKALLAEYRTNAKDDIEVYYINKFLVPAPGTRAGEAYRASAVPAAKYADSIISVGVAPYMTLAHEIGHILLDNGDHPNGEVAMNILNFMADPSQETNNVTDSRRIATTIKHGEVDVAQANDLLTKRPNLLSPP